MVHFLRERRVLSRCAIWVCGSAKVWNSFLQHAVKYFPYKQNKAILLVFLACSFADFIQAKRGQKACTLRRSYPPSSCQHVGDDEALTCLGIIRPYWHIYTLVMSGDRKEGGKDERWMKGLDESEGNCRISTGKYIHPVL